MLKNLKKLFIYLIVFACISCSFPVKQVKAENHDYLRVLKNEAYIYSDVNLTNKIFAVPYGYFVEIESVTGDFARVCYGSNDGDYPVIIGYMNKNDLTVTSITPTKPYSVIKVTSGSVDILFSDVDLKKAYFNVPVDTFMYYYGEVTTQNATLCYVYCNKKLGYVDKNALNPFTVPTSPDEIITAPPNNETDGDNENNGNDNGEDNSTPPLNLGENLQIIIIVGISVISVSVVYFLFKPVKKSDDETEEE